MIKTTITIEDKEIELNLKQKAFCESYVSQEFFANGVQSYVYAYNIDINRAGAYNSARSMASLLLTNVDILLYINHLLDLSGLNDAFVDKQLALIITQNADFGSKLGGIREYNKLKERVKDKLDTNVTISFK